MIWLSSEQKHAGLYILTDGKIKAMVVAESETTARKLFFKKFKVRARRVGTVTQNTDAPSCHLIED